MIPTKPRYGEKCNNCGACCMASLCHIARALRPDLNRFTVCPYLFREGDKLLCRVMRVEEEKGGSGYVMVRLAEGVGCGMTDPDTTDAERQAFRARAEAVAQAWMDEYPKDELFPEDDYLKPYLP